MKNPLTVLKDDGHHFLLASYSALDSFFRVREPGSVFLNTGLSLVALARIFDHLCYPGLSFEDAAVYYKDCKYIFRCVENPMQAGALPYTAMELLYDTSRNVFLDYGGIYGDLRRDWLQETDSSYPYEIRLMEAARMISRYHYIIGEEYYRERDFRYDISIAEQREFLCALLCSGYPEKGLQLLNQAGFLKEIWPEIYRMVNVKQTKDYHPEGDVWEHTLETFRYRKKIDLVLSLALLFHDAGKPVANGTQERPFDGHSELGAKVAARFLKRLRFPPGLIRDVCFLIRYHMMPFAIPKLPLYRSEKVLSSPLFPLLLEVYRADTSASFVGPDGYYEACRFYRNYLRDKRNPYRNYFSKHYQVQ